MTKDGVFSAAFDYTVDARFDYPLQMDIRTRYIPTGHEMDAAWNSRVHKDVVIDASGQWTETNATGASRDLGDQHQLRDLIKSAAVETPILLGMWVNEHPDRFEIIRADEFGNILFRVMDMNWQGTLAHADDPARAWISKLESIDATGTIRSWYDFDDPVRIEGASVLMGSIRTPVSIKSQPSPREGLSANLQYARRVDPPAPVVLAPTAAEQPAASEPVPPSVAEQQPAPGRSMAVWWVAGGLAAVVLVTGWFVLSRRAA